MCNKRQLNKGEALLALLTSGGRSRQDQRGYYCKDCKAWHLTGSKLLPPHAERGPQLVYDRMTGEAYEAKR